MGQRRPRPETPRLFRQASANQINWTKKTKLLCEPAEAISDECESVDDLDALMGTGYACGPGGASRQSLCPSYAGRVSEVKPASITDKPCGPAACENREVKIEDSCGTVTHVLFYDDPSCHSEAPAPECSKAAHRCYYRVLAVATVLVEEET